MQQLEALLDFWPPMATVLANGHGWRLNRWRFTATPLPVLRRVALCAPLAAMAADVRQHGGPVPTRHCIAMASDFFFPRLGGVEGHIWALSQCLLAMGHKVIVLTGTYAGPPPSEGGTAVAGRRAGVRVMTGGLKVYYLPLLPCFDQAIFPSYWGGLALLRKIFIREGVGIVHGHAATSLLAHEALIAGCLLGLRTVFTDHSLFGFGDAASINVNKYLKLTLAGVDAAISVSHTGRENLALRAALNPAAIYTIPNAVDAAKFTPDAAARARRPGDPLTIVMLSRLVYRKGIDLAVRVIPAVCAARPDVRFIIGGDGPKRLLLEEMRDTHGLHGRVELLGAVPHDRVRDVLVRGHVFLNASLTEAFCIAILEAACCGCFVVSTRVGGVPEVLPARMIRFAEPEVGDLVAAVLEALPLAEAADPASFHAELAGRYSWPDTAARVGGVYDAVAAAGGGRPTPLVERFRRWAGVGWVFGAVGVALMALLTVMCALCEAWDPAGSVELAADVCRGRGGGDGLSQARGE